MLQIYTNSFINKYGPCDLQGTNMPSANKAERLNSTCLFMAGSSGKSRARYAREIYLEPGVILCTPE